MKFFIVAIRDLAVQSYMPPQFTPHVGSALRSFSDEINFKDSQTPLHAHPEDFELHLFGEFESDSGEFVCGKPTVVSRGKDVVKVPS